MQIPKISVWLCALTLCGNMVVRAEDTPEQAAARAALLEKLNELQANSPATAAEPVLTPVTKTSVKKKTDNTVGNKNAEAEKAVKKQADAEAEKAAQAKLDAEKAAKKQAKIEAARQKAEAEKAANNVSLWQKYQAQLKAQNEADLQKVKLQIEADKAAQKQAEANLSLIHI